MRPVFASHIFCEDAALIQPKINGTLQPFFEGQFSWLWYPYASIPLRDCVCSGATLNRQDNLRQFPAPEVFIEAVPHFFKLCDTARHSDFLRRHENLHVLYLEIGVGANTPVIIKYPFWQMTRDNRQATYACLNYGEAYCPKEIEKQAICIDGDTAEVLEELK